MQEITVEIRNNYGSEAIYPVDENGKTFARLAGTRTLTRGTIELIKQLGYKVNVQQETVTI